MFARRSRFTCRCGYCRDRCRTHVCSLAQVVPEEKTFGYQGAVTRQKWKEANIVFVGDYVEAACHAYKNGLIQVHFKSHEVTL